ncbi:hypothetical protein [Taibaiella koreensis]|uniref:hypothetical protein n=1 Tax=Taibaiella koreensis TaxID=1268548 RepID=UPI0013C2C3BB|nr:hypothetical protein [Taibaiella koreensis]
MKRKILIITGILAIMAGILWIGALLSPGSYVNAEKYEVNTDGKKLSELIRDFKKDNPKYNVPPEVGIADGRRDSSDLWFHVYFYYPEEDEIVKTWIQADGRKKTTFAFVAINKGLRLGNWSYINKDFSHRENKEQKRRFEDRILNKLKEMMLPAVGRERN